MSDGDDQDGVLGVTNCCFMLRPISADTHTKESYNGNKTPHSDASDRNQGWQLACTFKLEQRNSVGLVFISIAVD